MKKAECFRRISVIGLFAAAVCIICAGITPYRRHETRYRLELITTQPAVQDTQAAEAQADRQQMTKVQTASTAEMPVSGTVPLSSTVNKHTTDSAQQTAATVRQTTESRQTAPRQTQAEAPESDTPQITFPLNLNTAAAQELTAIPGVGEVLAGRIVDYREQHGGFLNRQQLLEIDGIGEHLLAVLMDYTYLDEEVSPAQEEAEVQPADIQPPAESVPEETQPPAEELTFTEPLEMNRMTFDEVMCVPGMDEETAHRILDFRAQIHFYSDPLELRLALALDRRRADALRPYFYVDAEYLAQLQAAYDAETAQG